MKSFKNYKGYALYILLTCVLCVGCNNTKEKTVNNNIKTEKMKSNNGNTALGYTKEPLKCITKNSIAIGYEHKQEQGTKLEQHQLAFIEMCKREGKLGCSLTINNQQTYVSFYTFNPSVGNAR